MIHLLALDLDGSIVDLIERESRDADVAAVLAVHHPVNEARLEE